MKFHSLKPTLNEVIAHARNHEYMSGVERDKLRTKQTGEVFTPTPLVQEILDQLPQETFTDPTKTFLDPSCGDGQFLSEVLIRKMENGSTFEQALSTIYGVDLMQDNVDLCRERLLCDRTDLAHIVKKNIVCHDALTYDYSFNGTDMTDAEKHESDLFGNTLSINPKTKGQKKGAKKPLPVVSEPHFDSLFGSNLNV
jgi:type I restriction-modification system DNA methylase subunit